MRNVCFGRNFTLYDGLFFSWCIAIFTIVALLSRSCDSEQGHIAPIARTMVPKKYPGTTPPCYAWIALTGASASKCSASDWASLPDDILQQVSPRTSLRSTQSVCLRHWQGQTRIQTSPCRPYLVSWQSAGKLQRFTLS